MGTVARVFRTATWQDGFVDEADAEIVQCIQRGDLRSAVDRVHRSYARDLRAFLRHRLWSDDAVDEVMSDIFKSLMKDLAGFRGDARLRTWLHTVTRHAMIRFFKRERTRDERARPLEENDENLARISMGATYKQWIRQAYKQLADEERALVDLWIEGSSWKEAADQLGSTEEATRKRFTRLMKRLGDES